MTRGIAAGAAYFTFVFALGFLLGTARVLVLIPRLGELYAVLIEMPIILGASWWICGFLLKRLAVPEAVAARLAMCVTAFALLILGEFTLSVVLFGQTPDQFVGSFHRLAPLVGLVGQIMFAGFPLARR